MATPSEKTPAEFKSFIIFKSKVYKKDLKLKSIFL